MNVRRLRPWLSPLVAGTLALVAVLCGWRGVDLPAQLYRVGLFHREGLTLWNSQWYGGHWTLDYSVIFPPIAGVLGLQVTEILSAVLAAWAFDRLVVAHFGPWAGVGSLLFAVGTLAQVAIGQLPFLLGEGLALAACWAVRRDRFRLGFLLAAATSLASPLAGAFVALATVAGVIATWPRCRWELSAVAGGAIAPVIALALLFPGQGAMPFPTGDFAQLGVLFAGLWLVIPRRQPGLRIGVGLYLAAVAASFAVATPVGGNISRLGECLGAPLAVCVLWPHRRWLLAAGIVPLVGLQWSPAFATFTTDRADPSTHAAYYDGLLRFLGENAAPPARVEVVPTRLHWEAAYVAPTVALARGWERQLDTADNPLFYSQGAVNPASYRAWLLDNGVRYVALPDAPLDYAATEEGRLLRGGVGGLSQVWGDAHWRVFEVAGSSGLVEGPARLERLGGGVMTLDVTAPGTVMVRIRYSARWDVVVGTGCVRAAAGRWTEITGASPGQLRVELRMVGDRDVGCNA